MHAWMSWMSPHAHAQVGAELAEGAAYHVARKKIPCRGAPGAGVAGVKLELFIFDTFPSAERFALMEVARADEFAPVKNAPGAHAACTDAPAARPHAPK